MDPFIGQIILFGGNFAPRDWAFCDGRLLSISQYAALFSILGTTYGGDGRTTFALPDLRGRAPIHAGQGPGLSPYTLGQSGGSETVSLSVNQMPQHAHTVAPVAANAEASQSNPNGNVPAITGSRSQPLSVYAPHNTASSAMAPTTSSMAGGGLPHENRPPFLALNYIIALNGIFPSRD